MCTRYNVDILFLQETWLTDANSHIISNSLCDYVGTHTSAMEHKITSGMLVGRPFRRPSSLPCLVETQCSNSPEGSIDAASVVLGLAVRWPVRLLIIIII